MNIIERLQKWDDFVIVLGAFLTGVLIWYSHGMTFALTDLRRIWWLPLGTFDPAVSVFIVMLCINAVSTLYIWLFCVIARVIGLGRLTVFLLFLLLNFNPEFNAVRLRLEPIQFIILLWTSAIWLFLRDYKTHLYRAFLLWFGFMLCAAIIEPAVWLWLIGFPLCFLIWPGSGQWLFRFIERLQFFCVYYVLCAVLIVLIPYFHHDVASIYINLAMRLEHAMSAMSVFISNERSFSLTGYDAFLIAWVLVLINIFKNAGFIILGILVLALLKRPSSVLPRRTWLFFAFNLGFATVYGALSLLYLGHLQSDLLYVPTTMLILWMCASAVFYLYQRWRTQRMPAQQRLVLSWLMVSYAIASMIQFGTSSDYLRNGGVWAFQHRHGAVYANSYQALFFAGESPITLGNMAFWDGVLDREHLPDGFVAGDFLLYKVNRHQSIPVGIKQFAINADFHNRRGDRLFVLSLPER